MEANGFFGNWAKYSMENKMTLKKRIEYVLLNPEVYDRTYLVGLLSEASYAINGTEPAKKKINFEEINDYIYDESGGVIGSAGPLKIDSAEPAVSRKSDYFACRQSDVYSLEHQVNKMVKVGYKPVGGIVHIDGKFYQAMFLDDSLVINMKNDDVNQYNKDYLHF